tara:strand:+ start:398 stop:658 length:261 start_codon:yes stop_codon:yes gene_type:complete
MNINHLSEIIKKKISEKIDCKFLEVEDKTYLHLKHKTHSKDKFHIKLVLKSLELSKLSKIQSTRIIYKILDEELNSYIHSIQIELI